MAEIIRDSKTGKIITNKLTSEEASELGRRRWEKQREGGRNRLLQEAGYDNPDDAPELVKQLADIIISGKSGAVGATGQLLKLVNFKGLAESPLTPIVFNPPGRCPTCGYYVARRYDEDPQALAKDQIEWLMNEILNSESQQDVAE